jgi:hypothetical protein
MAEPYKISLPRIINRLQNIYINNGELSHDSLGRLIATLQNLAQQQQPQQQQSPGVRAPMPPSITPGGGGSPGGGGGSPGGGNSKFTDFFYPVSDSIGVGAGIGAHIANAVYKTKAAKHMARGNSTQHLASALSTPQSQAIFGNPLGELAKVSAEAGQANATKDLATGEAISNSLQDISNFVSSINTMRRLMKGDALNAAGLYAVGRLLHGLGRGS